jgi:hypothetical protein
LIALFAFGTRTRPAAIGIFVDDALLIATQKASSALPIIRTSQWHAHGFQAALRALALVVARIGKLTHPILANLPRATVSIGLAVGCTRILARPAFADLPNWTL